MGGPLCIAHCSHGPLHRSLGPALGPRIGFGPVFFFARTDRLRPPDCGIAWCAGSARAIPFFYCTDFATYRKRRTFAVLELPVQFFPRAASSRYRTSEGVCVA